MEHIIASNLTKRTQSPSPSAARLQRKAIVTQFIQLTEHLGRQLIQDKKVDLVLFNSNKAFDKFSHLKLLFKLPQHNVKGNILNWIHSQAVVLNGESLARVPGKTLPMIRQSI